MKSKTGILAANFHEYLKRCEAVNIHQIGAPIIFNLVIHNTQVESEISKAITTEDSEELRGKSIQWIGCCFSSAVLRVL